MLKPHLYVCLFGCSLFIFVNCQPQDSPSKALECERGCNLSCLLAGGLAGEYQGTATRRFEWDRSNGARRDTSYTTEEVFELIHVDSSTYRIKWESICGFFYVHEFCDARINFYQGCSFNGKWKYDVREIRNFEFNSNSNSVEIMLANEELYETNVYDIVSGEFLYSELNHRYLSITAFRRQ